MTNTIIISILISLAVNEFLGITDWLAYRITKWAAKRWKKSTGFDHLEEWLEDLEHSPGRLFRVVSASWLLLSTFVGAENLTLNLPTIWRWSRPLRSALHDALHVLIGLVGSLGRRISARFRASYQSKFHTAAMKIAVSLLPKKEQSRYIEEWVAELEEVPEPDRNRWVIQLVLSAPRLAIWMRLGSAKA